MANSEGLAPEKYFQPEKKSDIYDDFADGKVTLGELLKHQEDKNQPRKKLKRHGPATANNMTLDRLFNIKGGSTLQAKRLSGELDGTSAEAKLKSSDDVEEFKISASMVLDGLDADSELSEEPAKPPAPKKAIQTTIAFAHPKPQAASKAECHDIPPKKTRKRVKSGIHSPFAKLIEELDEAPEATRN